MAELMAWPLNMAEYAYNAEDVQRWMAGKTSGVYGAEDNWQVVAKSGMQVTVKAAGQVGGWLSNMGIHGVVFWNSTDIDLTVPTADGVNPRIDRVVVSWHIPQQTSVPTVEVRKGTPSINPAGPVLVNDGEYAEICLAEIRLSAGQTEISSQHIVDTRMDSSLCGIVSMGIEKYPTDGLEAEFRDWLDNLKTNLDENTAANLLNNIETHKADTTVHFLSGEKSKLVQPLSHSKSGTVHALTGLSEISGLISCVFKATADFTTGDTFTVDGTAYTAQLSNGETAEDNLFVTGVAVPIIVDVGAKKVNFKAGGGYAEGDVIAAGKVEVVYDPESLDFITYAVLGKTLSSTDNTLYVNPQGTRAYVDSGSYLSTYSMDGTKIAQKTITLSGRPAFDDQGNLYSIATEDSSDYYLYQFKADGTAKQLKYVQSYSVVFWANSRINVNDFSTLYQYSSAGTQVGKFTLPDSSIKAGCQGDGTAIYVVSSSKLYKLTSTGTQTWAASLSPIGGSYNFGLAYYGGYVYLMDGNRSSKIQRYSSAGSKDSSWSSVYASSGGSLSVATFGTKKYLKLYYSSWGSYLIQFSSGQTALALTDTIVGNSYSIADDVGAVYYNWRDNLMRLYPAATGYKILEG